MRHAEEARGRLVFPVPETGSLLAALRVALLAEDHSDERRRLLDAAVAEVLGPPERR